jgi:hypothetical protein
MLISIGQAWNRCVGVLIKDCLPLFTIIIIIILIVFRSEIRLRALSKDRVMPHFSHQYLYNCYE